MTENSITLTAAADKIIASDVRAFRADGKRYAEYVAEMMVVPETVAAHVAMFRNAFKAANKSATPEQVKAYATKVRNGLNYNVGKATKDPKAVDWMRLIRQAVENGVVKGGLSADAIMSQVADVLDIEAGTQILSVVA